MCRAGEASIGTENFVFVFVFVGQHMVRNTSVSSLRVSSQGNAFLSLIRISTKTLEGNLSGLRYQVVKK